MGVGTKYGKFAWAIAMSFSAIAAYVVAAFVLYPADSKASSIMAMPLYNEQESPVASFSSASSISEISGDTGTLSVLFDQTYEMGPDGISSQEFEPDFSRFDSQAADDFEVPSNTTWTIQEIDVAGAYRGTGLASSVNVYVYEDVVGTEGPGNAVITKTHVLPTGGMGTGDFQITLAQPIVLSTGRYWVSVQAQQDYRTSGQWFWRNQAYTVNSFDVAQWRNPADGFGRGICTVWKVRWRCQGNSQSPADQAFRLLGSSTNATATATRTGTPPTATASGTARPSATGTLGGLPSPVLTVVAPLPTNTSVPDPASPTLTPEPDPCSWSGVLVDTPSIALARNEIRGIDVGSANDIWAVGEYVTADNLHHTLTMHWNGISWTNVPSPSIANTNSILRDVAVVGANDVWAVGWSGDAGQEHTLTLHWDGSNWTIVSSPNPGATTNKLLGVDGVMGSDVWAVGSRKNATGATVALAMRWNGSAWVVTTTPVMSGNDDELTSVSVASNNSVWAAGRWGFNPIVEKWNGSFWNVMYNEPMVPNRTNVLESISASGTGDVWAVGWHKNVNLTSPDSAMVLHFNGTSWSMTNLPGHGGTGDYLYGVEANSANDVWAVGTSVVGANFSLAAHWNGTVWTYVPLNLSPQTALYGIATVGVQDAWAVGSALVGTRTVTMGLHFSTPCISSCAVQFEDIPNGSTFYSYVRCMACQGIVTGYPCGGDGEPCGPTGNPYFRPNANVTRGQIAKIVANAAGFSEAVTGQTFEDVAPGSTFYEFVQRLTDREIMAGYPCGNPEPCGPGNLPYFRPSANATRGQLAKIVANTANLHGAVSGQAFEDVTAGSTFYEFVERLAAIGAMGGYPCGNPEPCGPGNLPYFRPSNSVTRGQTSKIVANTFFPSCEVVGRR